MSHKKRNTCPNCRKLAATIRQQKAQIAELKEQLAQANKNSANSSKPPSSDIVKPRKGNGKKGQKKRQRGGQPGHPRHQRPVFPPEAIDQIHYHELDICPICGTDTLELVEGETNTVQQIELSAKPFRIEEHRGLGYWCGRCQKYHYAPLPAIVEKGGLFGPRLTALVAYLKGACHASFSTIRKFLRDVVGIKVSRGYLAKLLRKVSASLANPYQELLKCLPGQAILNVDETGHKDNGQQFWTWCFRAELFALFKIDPNRNAEVLIEVLGAEFEGVLGCDYFGAYRRYMREFDVVVQFCLAHLIREVKFLLELPDAKERAYGKRLRYDLRKLFAVIHDRENLTAADFTAALTYWKGELLRRATTRVPLGKHAQNLAKRFRKHGEAYFQFITTPGLDPTNNLVEQALRFVVIDRLVTQGTRSEAGQRWSERIWTAMATCAIQGRSVFEYLYECLLAHFTGQPFPSLLPTSEIAYPQLE